MLAEKDRRTSPLQRRIMVVLAALDARHPGTPVPTRLIEHLLTEGGDAPVYGPNLRASCRKLEEAGWLRTLRAPNLQLAVELTEAGRTAAAAQLQAVREAEEARRREAEVRVLASLPGSAADEEFSLRLNGQNFMARGAAYVMRLDGSTCLQLDLQGGVRTVLKGDALQVADWYRACASAGLPVRVQINEDGGHQPSPAK